MEKPHKMFVVFDPPRRSLPMDRVLVCCPRHAAQTVLIAVDPDVREYVYPDGPFVDDDKCQYFGTRAHLELFDREEAHPVFASHGPLDPRCIESLFEIVPALVGALWRTAWAKVLTSRLLRRVRSKIYAPGGTGFQAALARQRSLFRESIETHSDDKADQSDASEESGSGEDEDEDASDESGSGEDEDEDEDDDVSDESGSGEDEDASGVVPEVFAAGNLVCLQVPEMEDVFAHWPCTLPGAVVSVKTLTLQKVEVSVQDPVPTELVKVDGDYRRYWDGVWAVRPVQLPQPEQPVRPVTHVIRGVHDANKCARPLPEIRWEKGRFCVNVTLPWQPYVAPWLTPKELLFFEARIHRLGLPPMWRAEEGYQLMLTDTCGLLELAKAKLRRALHVLGKDPRTALQRFVLHQVLEPRVAIDLCHIKETTMEPVRILPTIRPAVDVDDLDPATGKPRRIICHGVSDCKGTPTPRLVWAKMTDVSGVTLLNNPDPRFGPTTEALHPWRWSSATSTWV
jgi:hypothetical protein